jgi:predicted metal-dependent hydrolase
MRGVPVYAAKFLEGVAHFNALEFWHAHESWEELWLEAETDVEQFLQGMIQLAAAYHHVKRGTYRGGVRLFDAALRRLDAFPRDFSGIDRTAAEEAARTHRALFSGEFPEQRLDESQYPKLMRTASQMPPREPW